jgi:hypothetical protein
MLKPSQHRTLGISGDALPMWGTESVLAPVRLHGTETLGRLYRYALDVVTVESPTLPAWRARKLVVADRLVGQVIDYLDLISRQRVVRQRVAGSQRGS